MTVATYEPTARGSFDVITGGHMQDFSNFAKVLATAGALPQGVMGNPANLLYLVLEGIDLGLRPMAALRFIDMISGKPALSAEGKRALILGAGHEIEVVEETDDSCTVRGRRRGSETWHTARFTMADARKAGLLKSGSNWEKYPSAMLFARATSRLADRHFADVCGGMPTAEEVRDEQPATPRLTLAEAAAKREAPAETVAEAFDAEAAQRRVIEAEAAFTTEPTLDEAAGDGAA